jgi:phage terminase large subunit-like protein
LPAKPISRTDYAERATQYAKDVIAEKIPACEWVRLACKRHLNDLERAKTKEFRWRFDHSKANRYCKFHEALPHIKGKWASAGEKLGMQEWDCFVFGSLFGWVDKETGNYRFRKAYVCVPRKNAKSTKAAAVGLYKFAADGEYGAEVYSGATGEKQAWEVFRPARLMVERTPALKKAFGIGVGAKNLWIQSNGSRFEPVIGKPGDGASPSCAIVDEYHEHKSDELFDTMLTGMGARENPLMLVITTAGSDRSGPCYQLQVDVQDVLRGKREDERLFGIVYTIDEKDDWTSKDALVKANPNYGVSVSVEFLEDEQKAAIQSARKQNVFKTKHLNVWVNAAVSWMNMVKWDACADPHLKLEEFDGQDCLVALDLASRTDLAAKVRLFKRLIDGKRHYYVFGNYYINEEAVERSANSQAYQGWANEGKLSVTPGDVTDLGWVVGDLVEDANRFRVLEIPHDPYQALPVMQFVSARKDWDQSIPFVPIRQSVENMSPAMKETEALVFEGRLHHDGDPVLAWAIANVVCWKDLKDNIFPRKEREENKIDPAVALFMAIGRAEALPDVSSVYESRGVISF